MGFFSRLLGDAKSDGPLGYALEVSDGLRAFGQREVAIAVRLRTGEDEAAVREVLRSLLASIRTFAADGRLVDEGGITEFGPRGFLDPRVRAVGYGVAPGCAEFDLPSDGLVAVLLFADEAAVARATSVARVLARIGEVTREYPFPTISDRDRASVASPRESESMLAMVARIHVPALSVVMEGSTVILSARRGVGPVLQGALAQLPANTGFALLTAQAPRANGQLVWSPGQQGPAAITPPGSPGTSLSGSMFLVATGQGADEVRVQEDGFAFLARDETWSAVRRALVERTAFELPPAGAGPGLRVEHPQEGSYVPAGGLRGPEEIVLLTPEDVLRDAIAIEELSAYIQRLIAVLEPVDGVELCVELSDGPARISCDPAAAPELESALRDVEAPRAQSLVTFLIRKPLPT